MSRPPQQPETFGKYHLLEKIATGGMAEVYRARSYGSAGFERILVIKKVLDHLAQDEEFLHLFRDEALLAGNYLNHKNIVQVYEYDVVDHQHYMAMEYVHGLDLSRLISRARNLGEFPLGLALMITYEVLAALDFAHSRRDEEGHPLKVVHCDISPQNILVSYAGEVKLTDFGISRAAFQAQSQHEVIRGKYAYMSPEQVEGKKLDGRSDLFSLAIVLYEAITGRRLFKARSREETLARVRRADVPSPRAYRSEISEDLEGFLLKSLSRRRDDRFQTAAEMMEALSRIVVREGLRSSSSDLANFVHEVIESANLAARGIPEEPKKKGGGRSSPPTPLVVLSVEAAAPPRSIAAPRTSLDALASEWRSAIEAVGGEIWEDRPGSFLVVWRVGSDLAPTLKVAVELAEGLERSTRAAGYRLSAGVAPGVARIAQREGRPAKGWELAGPFYLARWMMNLSAHRGRILLTEVGRKQVQARTSLLGRIPIQGNRFITLYELG